eukprot:Gb_31668 [translate_table: standard]
MANGDALWICIWLTAVGLLILYSVKFCTTLWHPWWPAPLETVLFPPVLRIRLLIVYQFIPLVFLQTLMAGLSLHRHILFLYDGSQAFFYLCPAVKGYRKFELFVVQRSFLVDEALSPPLANIELKFVGGGVNILVICRGRRRFSSKRGGHGNTPAWLLEGWCECVEGFTYSWSLEDLRGGVCGASVVAVWCGLLLGFRFPHGVDIATYGALVLSSSTKWLSIGFGALRGI